MAGARTARLPGSAAEDWTEHEMRFGEGRLARPQLVRRRLTGGGCSRPVGCVELSTAFKRATDFLNTRGAWKMPLFGPPDIQKMKAKRDVNGRINALSAKNSAPIRQKAAEGLGEIGDALTSVNSLK